MLPKDVKTQTTMVWICKVVE